MLDVITLCQENVLLAPYTTLSIGGPARYFIRAGSEAAVEQAVTFAKDQGVPTIVIGGGSNLLVADEGFQGLVIRIEIGGRQWLDVGSHVQLMAGAGEDWDSIVAESVERNLYGLECLSGIPGSVGGTPVQNVGAYGQEVAETLSSVRVLDRHHDLIAELSRQECGFSYRSSIFNTVARGRYIVLAVTYLLPKTGRPATGYADVRRELEQVPAPTLAEVRAAVRRIRARKAMLLMPDDPDSRSAGSFFKNPVVSADEFARIEAEAERQGVLRPGESVPRYKASGTAVKTAAAWLIERSGVAKGFSLGPAAVSAKHTLALVNRGGARAADVLALAREIRRRVYDRFGVRLAVEPVLVGFSDEVVAEMTG